MLYVFIIIILYDKKLIARAASGTSCCTEGVVGWCLCLEDVTWNTRKVSGVYKTSFLVSGTASIGVIDKRLNSRNIWHFLYTCKIFYFSLN
jgi:hypothetical protein|tara:strand:+ start:7926 stop:8198 length:273 start_codon:yes stop_codon:yes gene_type:complete